MLFAQGIDIGQTLYQKAFILPELKTERILKINVLQQNLFELKVV